MLDAFAVQTVMCGALKTINLDKKKTKSKFYIPPSKAWVKYFKTFEANDFE